jgi:gliding motility-associated-like protein
MKLFKFSIIALFCFLNLTAEAQVTVPCNVDLTYGVSGGCCTYQFNLYDSAGDGWEGASVSLNGTAYTVTSGSSQSFVAIDLCDGDAIDIDYTASGTSPGEVSFELLDAQGSVIYASGAGPGVANNVFVGTGACLAGSLVLDCNGGDITLVADGIGEYELVMNNDFNSGGVGPGWVSTGGAAVGTPCGASLDGTDYYWASTSTGTPNLTTAALDVSCGGTLSFDMAYSTQGGATPCEGPDEPDEGVTFQYSTDGGVTWIILDYWDPLGGYDPTLTSWNTYTFTIPPGAIGPNTQFQWVQLNSSGTCCDNWGVDNVEISSVVNCAPYVYDYTQVPGNDNNPIQNETVTSTTTFTVWYGNGLDSCYADITIVVPPGTNADAGLDQVYCSGGPAVTIGNDAVSFDETAVYSWSTGAGGTLDFTGGVQDNGQITVSPLVTTDYYLEVTFNGCTAYDTVTVTVDAPPTASNPANINVQCSGDVPAWNVNVVTDEADDFTTPPTVTYVGDVSDGLTCPETITRTYRVTDGCGNFVDVTQLIIIDDTQVPVMNAAPGALAVQCAGDVPAMTNLGWTDNCDGAGNVAGNDVSDGLSCPETITRTWTFTDACGNTSVAATQTITVNDTQVPVFAAPPANVTVECAGDVPAMTNLGWTDNCDGAANVAGIDGALVGGPCGGTITRTWTYTDACGNNATVTQTITVDDTIPPTATNPAPQVGAPPAFDPLQVTDEADNCSVPTVTNGGDVSDGGNCPEIITRTYIITDACGNSINVTQTFTVGDAIFPTASNPLAVNVQCSGDVPATDPTVVTDEADNGVNPPTVTWEDDTSDGLSCPETILRRYRVTDDCGNFIFVTQTITIQDTQVPVFAAPPADLTVECAGDVPAMTDLGWTDNCDGAGTVTGADGALTGGACGGTITRTWTYTDACGNNATVTQTITVDDTTPPTATNPAPQSGVPPAFDPLQVTDEADNCSIPTVTNGGDVSDGGNCPEIITRTYIVTDACGNSINVTQTFTVGDAVMPTASNPLPINVECQINVPATDPTVVTDEADNGTPPVVTWEDDTSDGLTCPETILRRYRVTDNCGNFIFVTQTITVMDITVPIMNAPPAAVAVQCIGDVPVMTDLGYTDNCDAAGTVTGSDVSDGLTCPETITRSWFHTDACGNVSATVTQTITVQDTQVPVIAGTPAAVAVQCIGDVPAMIDLGYTDNCDAPGTVTGADVSDGLTCPETITRTWTFTDACGNNATETQTITVQDTQVPVFAAPPADLTVECTGDVPAMTDLGWTDNCDGAGTVTGADGALTGGACGGTITRTWTFADACGNNATVTQTITVDDTTLPTASNPATTTVPGGPAPAVDQLVVIDEADNCTVNPVVAFVSEVSDNNPCPETITRIYSITDDCGNTINVTHLIVITDPILPTGTAPAAVNVECIGDVPAADPLLIIDEADNQGVPGVAFVSDVSDGLTCPETITRTYSITDVCGNVVLVTQLITVLDVTNPTGVAPATVNVECIGDVPAANILDVNDEADNCTVNPVVVFVGDVSDGLTCPETITRTYSITDDCGNQITVDQLIIVNDVTIPTGTGPATVNVECIGDVPANDPLLITNEADNCTVNPVVAFVSDVSDGLTCPETITRTYSITDDCGNQITVDQLIIVNDVTNPTASNIPPINVPGSMDVPAWNILDVTTEADNCTANPVVAFVSDVSDGNVCNGEIITRTYSVTDDCGNQILITQEITIDAVPAPIDAGLDMVICEGELVTIVAANPWYVPIVWNPVVPAGPFDPLVTTTFTVTADNLGCISTDDVTVTVTPLPVVSFSADVLSGCAPLEVTFTNTTPGITSDCVWSIGGVPYTGCTVTTSLGAGLYDVTLETTNGLGCSSLVTYTDYIYVEAVPLAQFTPSQTQMSNLFTEVIFTNNSVDATDYLWSMGDGASGTSVNASHTFPSDEGGSYLVELIAMSPLGCSDTAWVTVNVSEEVIYYVPNTFTPDGDTYNEYFKPIFTSGYDPYDFDLFIFNRWGEIVWESHDSSIGWDGTYGASGKLVQNGTYTWRIEFKTTETDERILVTGHVNVLD